MPRVNDPFKEKKPKKPKRPYVAPPVVPLGTTEYGAALSYCKAWKWYPIWVNVFLSHLLYRGRLSNIEVDAILQEVGISRIDRNYSELFLKA